jgi:hypothetical protein
LKSLLDGGLFYFTAKGGVLEMGNWNISINGVGAHNNGKDFDAEVMFSKFVAELRNAGHGISDATITIGSAIHDLPYHKDGDIYECYEHGSSKRLGCTTEPQFVGNKIRFAGSGSDAEYVVIAATHYSKVYSCIAVGS